MDTILITLTVASTIIVVACAVLTLCRQHTSRDAAEPVVGVQRHGRTYYVPRSLVDDPDTRGAVWAWGTLWRAVLVAVLGGSLLLATLLRLV